MARSQCKEGVQPERIRALASIGSRPSNEERDMMTWMRGYGGLNLEPYMLKVDLQIDRKRPATNSTLLPVLAPTE
eukprot:9370335-Pyramimonas_sp.AAC.1